MISTARVIIPLSAFSMSSSFMFASFQVLTSPVLFRGLRNFHFTPINLKNLTPRKLTGVHYTREEKNKVVLSPFHFQVLFGLLLGDLTMYKKPSGDVNFKVESST